MSSLPSVPYLKKGAIVQGIQVIPFQYTPTSLTRTLNINSFGQQARDLCRIKGPPTETLTIDILVDATDQLERGSGLLSGLGVYPALAALELLLYPNPTVVMANAVMSALGVLEIIPAEQPLTLLVWGVARIVPVQVTSVTVTEEQYDTSLTPLRASVKVSMQVLTYSDLGLLSVGGALSYVGHIEKTAMSLRAGYPRAKSLVNGINWKSLESAISKIA
ncbi:MAG: hypothetical protein U1A78_38270 [Polyangia bacterium]